MRHAILPALAAMLMALAPAFAAKPVKFDAAAFDARVKAAADAGLTGIVAVTSAQTERYRHASGPEADAKLWPWSSLSKQVIAALTMRLIDQGRLTLDTTIGRALPDFPNHATAVVTVRQLLNHTSGLPNPDATAPGANGVPEFYLRVDPMAGGRNDAVGFCGGPASAAPGAAFTPGNCDTIVLASVLEAMTGRQLTSLLNEEIKEPAGLTSLRFASPGEHPVEAHGGDGPVPRINIATLGAAGALLGSIDDALAFDRALMRRLLVSEAGTAQMWIGDPALGFFALGALAYDAPLAGCAEKVKLVERRGSVDGVQMRNIIAPGKQLALLIFTDNADVAFGDIRQGSGLSFDLASAAFCYPAQAEK